jgi:hypothetical protein
MKTKKQNPKIYFNYVDVDVGMDGKMGKLLW